MREKTNRCRRQSPPGARRNRATPINAKRQVADAPVKYETVLNLTTAEALGLAIPETLLATADELIQ